MLPLRLSFLWSLRKLFATRGLPRRPRPNAGAPAARGALRCEHLEDRSVPATVSALTSAVSFASPIDASGTTDLVTIAVKDTDGKPVSGLTGGDFTLSLSGGIRPRYPIFDVVAFDTLSTAQTQPISIDDPVRSIIVIDDPYVFGPQSTGTFGPVTEIGTSGTYYTQFTGALAGAPRTLTVSVGGTTLSSHPTVQVVPGAISASNSTVAFVNSGDDLSQSNALTISLNDAAGNAVTGLAGSAFRLGLSGGTLLSTAGSVTTLGPRSLPLRRVSSATTLGTSSSLVSLSDGTFVNTDRTATTLGTSVSQFRLSDGALLSTDGSLTDLGASAFQYRLSSGAVLSTFGQVTETSTAGVYTTTYTRHTASEPRTLTVSVNGVQLVTQLPVRMNWAGATNYDPPATGTPTPRGRIPGPDSSTGNGNETTPTTQSVAGVRVDSPTVASGTTDLVTIVVVDTAGLPINNLTNSNFTLSLSGGTSTGAFGQVTKAAEPGTYTTRFTGQTAGTPVTLTVSVNNVLIDGQPTIRVTPGAVSAANSTVSVATSVGGADVVGIGDGDVVAISAKDAAGNAVTGRPGAAFRLALSGGTSAGKFGSVTEKGTPGVYTAAFTGTAAGTPSTLTVSVDDAPLASRPIVQVTRVATPVPATDRGEVSTPAADTRPAPAAQPAVPAAPVFSGAFMFGNMMVLAGDGVPGGYAVVALPPGCFVLFADANGDGRGDVVLLVPHMLIVLDGVTGNALVVPF